MGYVGKKPADIIATAVDTTTGTFSGDLTVDTNTLYVDSANNNVGINTLTPSTTNLNSGTTSGIVVKSGGVAKNNFVALPSTGGAQWDIREAGGSGGEFTMRMFDTSGTHNVQINSNGNHFFNGGNVGIGTSSPTAPLHIQASTTPYVAFQDGTNYLNVGVVSSNYSVVNSSLPIAFQISNSEKVRIDASGNLLVGKTSATSTSVGFEARPTGLNVMTRDGDKTLFLNRLTSDGTIAQFYKDGTSVGSIGSLASGRDLHVNSTGGILTLESNFNSTERQVVLGDTYFGVVAGDDNAVDLGRSSARYKDLYLSGGAYIGGTGSANYLQDYEEGSWTPTVLGQTTNPTVTFSAQLGEYIKIGSMVYLWFRLTISTISGGSGTTNIGGLPFGIKSGNAFQANVGGMVDQIASDNKQVSLQPAPSSSVLILISDGGSTGSHAGLQVSELQASTDIRFQIAYSVS